MADKIGSAKAAAVFLSRASSQRSRTVVQRELARTVPKLLSVAPKSLPNVRAEPLREATDRTSYCSIAFVITSHVHSGRDSEENIPV